VADLGDGLGGGALYDLGEAAGELGGARGRSLQRRSGSVLH
jgi:hypothetical protein